MAAISSADITSRLGDARERIAAAAARSGRSPDGVTLLAVSKTVAPEAIQQAFDAGQTLFAENRVQELIDKAPQLPGNIEWHLIGHLQSNKIRKALDVTRRIHSVDSLKLAQQISRIATEQDKTVDVWLQVNVGGEESKFGFDAGTVERDLEALLGLPGLIFQGLMTVPPFTPDAEDARPAFAALRELRDRLEKLGGRPLPHLSMGMSHDFEVAIEEGATEVRVGSAIFGARKPGGRHRGAYHA